MVGEVVYSKHRGRGVVRMTVDTFIILSVSHDIFSKPYSTRPLYPQFDSISKP